MGYSLSGDRLYSGRAFQVNHWILDLRVDRTKAMLKRLEICASLDFRVAVTPGIFGVFSS
jgi:hypothetical protein